MTLALLLAAGCSTADERDLCCDSVTLRYRYVRYGYDEYRDFIFSQRHFLFDSEGLFVREVPTFKAGAPRDLKLSELPAGAYTMVTVGNATEGKTALTPLTPGVTRMADFRMGLLAKSLDGKAFADAEELFWNSRTFDVVPGKLQVYYCDMANVHCHLRVMVQWESLPPAGSDAYTLIQSPLVPEYALETDESLDMPLHGEPDPEKPTESGYAFVIHRFPRSLFTPPAAVVSPGELRGHDLYLYGVTLRYLDDHIPAIQIVHDGTNLFSKPIDLAPIFPKWGWFPSRVPEQIYSIRLYIRDDGFVEVSPWLESEVEDWIDGGTIYG